MGKRLLDNQAKQKIEVEATRKGRGWSALMEDKKLFPKKSKSPVKAIRYFCFECNGWDRRSKDSGKPFEDVKECTDPMCPLFDFRFGKNPFIKRKTLTKDHLEALQKGRKTIYQKGRSERESTISVEAKELYL